MKTILKELLEERGLSQQSLSVQTKIPATTISGWLRAGKMPDYYSLIKLADFFDVSLDYLCGRTAGISLQTAGYQPAAALTPKERRLIDDFKVLKDYEQTQILSLTRTIAENRTVIEAKRGD